MWIKRKDIPDCKNCEKVKYLRARISTLRAERDVEIGRGYQRATDVISGLLQENAALHLLLKKQSDDGGGKEVRGDEHDR